MKKLSNRSERVKAVDFHPTEPWLLSALYSGNIHVWNYETQILVKTFEVTDLPLRAAKFISRKNWVVAGSDDMHVRVFNYNTHEKVIAFEAHQDYIRSIAVHDSQPFLLTGSDDMTIKMWDWEQGWKNVMTFEGHSHYVMQCVFNPKDGNTFASASLDRTIKIWSISSSTANFTLEGHSKGVNCVEYYYGADKPYLISGADDKAVKVWDYQTKSCVQTLEGHTQNITVVCFHPELPIIISGGEDGTVRIWHSRTYRLESTLNYGMERVWALGFQKGSNDLALGYDEGTVSIQLGRDDPIASMDASGKIIYAKQSEILTANVRSQYGDESGGSPPALTDGDRLCLPAKELGSCDMYPHRLQHSPNGRFVAVSGDGEYVIYTSLAWRNKTFGKAMDVAWAADSNAYATQNKTHSVAVYKMFKEVAGIETRFAVKGVFGGHLVGVKGDGFVVFYDWETRAVVRRVDVEAVQIYWSEGDVVAIASADAVYMLRYTHADPGRATDAASGEADGDGADEAFVLVCDVAESVTSGLWIGDCFVFTSAANRLNFLVGGQVSALAHFDKPMFLLNFLAKENRIFLCDKDMHVTSYAFPAAMIGYELAILRGDTERAAQSVAVLTGEERTKIARFLEQRNMKEEAFSISADAEHQFELGLQLEKLMAVVALAASLDSADKWKGVADLALKMWRFDIAELGLRKANDLDALLLFYQASGNLQGMQELAVLASAAGKFNIAFLCFLLTGQLQSCVDLLLQTKRFAEAALFARTYMPSLIARSVSLWKDSVSASTKNHLHSQKQVADPSIASQSHLFRDFKYGLVAEDAFKRRRAQGFAPAADYAHHKSSLDWNVVDELKLQFPNGAPDVVAEPPKSGLFAADLLSDTMSRVSLEVHTAGSNSIRGDVDFDDAHSIASQALSSAAQPHSVQDSFLTYENPNLQSGYPTMDEYPQEYPQEFHAFDNDFGLKLKQDFPSGSLLENDFDQAETKPQTHAHGLDGFV